MGYEQLLLLDAHICSARTREGYRCRRSPLKGKRRCRLHGGASTGPKTLEGRKASLGALAAGHRQWYERKIARGYPFRGGLLRDKQGEGRVNLDENGAGCVTAGGRSPSAVANPANGAAP